MTPLSSTSRRSQEASFRPQSQDLEEEAASSEVESSSDFDSDTSDAHNERKVPAIINDALIEKVKKLNPQIKNGTITCLKAAEICGISRDTLREVRKKIEKNIDPTQRKPVQKVNAKIVEKVRELLPQIETEEVSYEEVAKQCQIAKKSIQDIVEKIKQGVDPLQPKAQQKVTPAVRDKIKKLLPQIINKTLSYEKAATQCGVSRNTIQRVVKELRQKKEPIRQKVPAALVKKIKDLLPQLENGRLSYEKAAEQCQTDKKVVKAVVEKLKQKEKIEAAAIALGAKKQIEATSSALLAAEKEKKEAEAIVKKMELAVKALTTKKQKEERELETLATRKQEEESELEAITLKKRKEKAQVANVISKKHREEAKDLQAKQTQKEAEARVLSMQQQTADATPDLNDAKREKATISAEVHAVKKWKEQLEAQAQATQDEVNAVSRWKDQVELEAIALAKKNQLMVTQMSTETATSRQSTTATVDLSWLGVLK